MNDEMRAGLERARSFWEERAHSQGSDLEKLEWAHHRTQRTRFEAFLLDHDLHGRSVLDLGCGLADFYHHLQQRGVAVEYTGYDIAPEMIRLCRARYPGVAFESGDFLEYRPVDRFDYTVAFGIHNITVPGAQAILEATTRHQFALSRLAAHVSLLTDRDAQTAAAAALQSWRAEQVFAMAMGITRAVTLRHHYLTNDFSVTLYRAYLADLRPDMLLRYEYE